MDSQTTSAIIGGASSLGSSIMDQLFAQKNMRMNKEYNKEMADYQYSKDLDMWNRNNIYNSPGAQMDRLQAAGLNPNLVYGQGAVANSSSQIPKYQAPQGNYEIPAPDIKGAAMTALNAYQDMRIKNQTLDNMEAIRKNTEARTANEVLESVYKTYTNRLFSDAYVSRLEAEKWKGFKPNYEAEKLRQDIRLRESQADYAYSQAAAVENFNKLRLELLAQNVKKEITENEWLGRSLEQKYKTSVREYKWMPINNVIRGLTGITTSLGVGKFLTK